MNERGRRPASSRETRQGRQSAANRKGEWKAMRGFLERLQWKMALWMEGRYGPDNLSTFLVFGGVILTFFSMIPGLDLFWIIGLISVIIGVLRTFSKNTAKRERENENWLRFAHMPKTLLLLARRSWADRATTKYFICKGCGAILSIPKGKGKLHVTCPQCHHQVEKNS